MKPLPVRGRGASANPKSRFDTLEVERDDWTLEEDPAPETRLLLDRSRSILARNDSPDVGFDVSINAYRGCEHGCVYCYARPTHEYLGMSAGLDFESRILVKADAPALLREALASPKWEPRVIAMSGVTDPYQPAERRLEITRRVLEVLAEFRNPVGVITKNHLVTRDRDLLGELAGHRAAAVSVSITTLDRSLQRIMEPRTSVPSRRLEAIRKLAQAGIPVGVNVAPVVPGLTDHELPAILEAAAEAGATRAGWIMLRLPHGVKDLFGTWLEQHVPDRKDKVLNRMRELRGGRLYDSRYGTRMKGEGAFAAQVKDLFEVTCRRVGLDRARPALSTAAFRRATGPGGQLPLFGEG